MLINILHGGRSERLPLLEKEIESQGLSMLFDCTIWEGLHDSRSVIRTINVSHKQIVRWAKDNFLQEVTIAEDDIKFTHPNSFRHYVDNKPKDFDVYLGGIYLGQPDANSIVIDFSALHLYTVNERFYDTFLSLPEDEHLDRSMAGLGKFVVCNPFVAIQHDNLFSSNTGKAENYSHLLTNYKLYNG